MCGSSWCLFGRGCVVASRVKVRGSCAHSLGSQHLDQRASTQLEPSRPLFGHGCKCSYQKRKPKHTHTCNNIIKNYSNQHFYWLRACFKLGQNVNANHLHSPTACLCKHLTRFNVLAICNIQCTVRGYFLFVCFSTINVTPPCSLHPDRAWVCWLTDGKRGCPGNSFVLLKQA